MKGRHFSILLILIIQGACSFSSAQEKEKEFDPFAADAEKALEGLLAAGDGQMKFLEPGKVAKLTAQIKPSVVTIRVKDRDGGNHSTGSGFIVADTGLIVTNRHVIGDGRAIEVEFHDGKVSKVIEINASDRLKDLAVIRIDPKGLKLAALPLGDSDALKQGQIVAGFGNPRGLEFSVVPALVSAIRELDANFLGDSEGFPMPMIQLAMPIEMGNSGGPVVNLAGEVVGIVTLKHRVTENLGYAVRSSDLRPLLDKPNPIPMSRWMTVGSLDERLWKPIMGAIWSQRGGVISSMEMGKGFGGRTLCLSEEKVPDLPYEVSVQVKLDSESGAAGLAFASDGGEKHYGFYPSGGRMRLTRFEGADVYSWTILEQIAVPAYKAGEWNEIKIRVEKDKLIGFVNGVKAMELDDNNLRGGKAGLCKFRKTEAEYRRFRVGKDLSEKARDPKVRKEMTDALSQFSSGKIGGEKLIGKLIGNGSTGRELIVEKIADLEKQAEEMRSLGRELHRKDVTGMLLGELKKPEAEIDLFTIAMQISRLDDEGLDIAHYRAIFDRLADDAKNYIDKKEGKLSSGQKVEALRDFLFKENGFHGSRGEYYHQANSYLNYVLDDREGLPITLSVLFIEMSKRLKLEGVGGVPIPGHFVTGFWEGSKTGIPKSIYDVFDGGKKIMQQQLRLAADDPEIAKVFAIASSKDIAVRMLRNLVGVKIEYSKEPTAALDYLEVILAIAPGSGQERFQRALIRYQTSDIQGATADLDWLLKRRPEGIDYERLQQFRDSLPKSNSSAKVEKK